LALQEDITAGRLHFLGISGYSDLVERAMQQGIPARAKPFNFFDYLKEVGLGR